MKIDAVVVLYNPDKNVFENIKTYSPVVNKIYAIDNSTNIDEELVKLIQKEIKNVEYVSLGGNQGIAKALNVGLQKAIDDKAEYCLTMDQDSKFPTGKIENIKKYLEDNHEEYGIISLNAKGVDDNDDFQGIKDVDVWITSGNFIVIENYLKTKGFKEELFIDLVDFELCEQFHNVGKKVGIIGEITINHKIGEPSIKKLLWKKIKVDNHSPIRYYYQFRNTEYLYRRNKAFYKRWHRDGYKVQLVQMLVGENKKERLKMIRKGRKDGRRGILGPYKEEK